MSRDPTSFLGEEYRALVQSDLDWKIRTLQGPSTPWCHIDGKKVLMLCSNNYLGLTNHPALKKAAIDAVASHGAGSGSVRAIAGNMDLHIQLEERLAHFKRAEASLVYQTGYAVNSGLIPQLVGEQDLVISDELNHGSIIDGVRLSRAERAVYKHADMADLDRVLNEAEKHTPALPQDTGHHRRRLLDGRRHRPPRQDSQALRRARGARLRRRRPRGGRPGRGRARHRLPLPPRQEAGPDRDGDLLQGLRGRRRARLWLARPDQLRLQQVPDLAAQRLASRLPSPPHASRRSTSWRTSPSASRLYGSTRGTSRRG